MTDIETSIVWFSSNAGISHDTVVPLVEQVAPLEDTVAVEPAGSCAVRRTREASNGPKFFT